MVRFLMSALAGTVVASGLLMTGLWLWGAFEPVADGPTAHRVDLVSESQRSDLAELFDEGQDGLLPRRATLPSMDEIPALELPARQARGFVQVEYVIDANGRVTGERVVQTTHPGVYEEQALERVRARRFSPPPDGARPQRMTEIVDFQVPAPE